MQERVNKHTDVTVVFRAVVLSDLAAIFWEALHHGRRRGTLAWVLRGEGLCVSQHFVRASVAEMLRSHGVSVADKGRRRSDYTEEMRLWCETVVGPVYFPGAH